MKNEEKKGNVKVVNANELVNANDSIHIFNKLHWRNNGGTNEIL